MNRIICRHTAQIIGTRVTGLQYFKPGNNNLLGTEKYRRCTPLRLNLHDTVIVADSERERETFRLELPIVGAQQCVLLEIKYRISLNPPTQAENAAWFD